MNEYKIFVQRIGLVGIANLLVALSSLILLPILTKNFSIDDYGIWVQINTTIALLPNLTTLGLPYTMVRFLSAETDKKIIQEGFYSILSMVLISTVIVALLLLVFSKQIALAIFNGNVNVAIILSAIVFLACLNALLLNYFRTFQEMKKYSFFLLMQTYLGVVIVSYLALEGYSIYMVALGLLLANLITFLAMFALIIWSIGFKIPKFTHIREYLSFGVPTIPGNLSSWIVNSSDRYVIGIFLSAAFVGYYSPGYTLGYSISMLMAPFSLLLPSVLPQYYDKNNIEKVSSFLNYSTKYFLLIAIPSAFGLSVLSKPLLSVLTTPEIALNGYLITPLTALSTLIFGVYAIISNVLVLEKKTKVIGSIWIIAATLNLVLNIVLVPYFGIIAAATTTLLAYVVAFILTLRYSTKFFNFDYKFILKSITASTIMSAFIIFINPQNLINIIITIIISTIIYFGLILVLKGIKKEEFNLFKAMFGKN
ncbi:MAG: oligosaccharide flippase family protein [Euryarchaeota archaeon]|uniref:oligosaccharide flippase family protein n=1 Tax=Methanobacterium sp. MZD130B TaxID=3394378 RepID=UPI0017546BAE|nr:oligosaccharide flippase family protein [Euryarchaeota archaeon]HHT19168.1 oligosaccharide flippase family protein [Methanobacterium sp.]